MRRIAIALAVFMCSFAIQFGIWIDNEMVDETVWWLRIEHLRSDLAQNHIQGFHHSEDFVPQQLPSPEKYSGHPGTTILLAGVALSYLGVADVDLVPGAVLILNSVLLAGIAVAAKTTWSHSLWWIGVCAMVLFHPLALQSSPTNNIAVSALTLLFILGMQLLKTDHPKRSTIIIFAMVLAFSLATRTPDTALLSLPLLFALWRHLKTPLFGLLAGIAVAFFVMFNPLVWQTPIEHAVSMFENSAVVYSDDVRPRQLESLMRFASLSLLTAALTITAYVLHARRGVWNPLSKSFLVVLTTSSVLYVTAILSTHMHSIRYFYPLFVLWEILFPLSLLLLIGLIPSSARSEDGRARWQLIQRYGPVLFAVSFQLLLFRLSSSINTSSTVTLAM